MVDQPMKIEVFSLTAAVGGAQDTTWKGDISLEGCLTQDDMLNRIYRLLNRVDAFDVERMQEWGYELPSLSVGDYVTIHIEGLTTGSEVVTYQVKMTGFAKITGNPNVLGRALIS